MTPDQVARRVLGSLGQLSSVDLDEFWLLYDLQLHTLNAVHVRYSDRETGWVRVLGKLGEAAQSPILAVVANSPRVTPGLHFCDLVQLRLEDRVLWVEGAPLARRYAHTETIRYVPGQWMELLELAEERGLGIEGWELGTACVSAHEPAEVQLLLAGLQEPT